MHPALMKGPLFTKKNTPPHFPLFQQKTSPIFHFSNKNNLPIFHFFTKNTPSISFPDFGPDIVSWLSLPSQTEYVMD